jgi:hypothetical protein
MMVKAGLNFGKATAQQESPSFPTAIPANPPKFNTPDISNITNANRMRYATHIAATFNLSIATLGVSEKHSKRKDSVMSP